ncbi:hypothetical protein AAC387_Pa06g0436 [Persea americana]
MVGGGRVTVVGGGGDLEGEGGGEGSWGIGVRVEEADGGGEDGPSSFEFEVLVWDLDDTLLLQQLGVSQEPQVMVDSGVIVWVEIWE